MVKYSETYDNLNPKRSYAMGNAIWANRYLGAPTSPFEVNQIQQIMQLVPSGIQNVEVGMLKPEDFETIPKQHFKQMKQLAKLTIRDFEKEGKPSPLSMHAPMIEPTGFSENKYNEDQWKQNQERLKDAVGKAAELGTSTPVTIHGSHQVSDIRRIDPKTKKEYRDVMAVVDPESGQVQYAKRELVHYPTEDKWETPQDRLSMINTTLWENKRREIVATDTERDRIGQRIKQITGKTPEELAQMSRQEVERMPREEQVTFLRNYREAQPFLSNYNVLAQQLGTQISSAFDKAFKAAEETNNKKQIQKLKEAQQGTEAALSLIRNRKFKPEIFIPVEKFARKKASETFAELAMESVRVAKNKGISPEKAPIISIENFSPEMAFGRGETMKALIDESRNKFFKKAVESGMSSSEARKLSNKLIGTTWDVGHINLLKKYGYDDKRLKKELDAIKKDIKHIHLTDNFGYHDAHLPPGMGNVPIKETLKELEKNGKMGEIRAIVEAGAYVKAFKQVPTAGVLQYMNAPLYAGGGAGWRDIQENYFFGSGGYVPGYGNFLPSEHFSMYGAGFSQLPTALGGVRPGEKDRFAGAPKA